MKKFLLVTLAAALTMAASARVNNTIVKTVPMAQKSQMVCNQLKNTDKFETVANFSAAKTLAPAVRKARAQKSIKADEVSLETIFNGTFIEDYYNTYDRENDLGLDECRPIQFKSYVKAVEVDSLTHETEDYLFVDIYGAFTGLADTVTAIVMEDTLGTFLYIPAQVVNTRYESQGYGQFVLYGAYESDQEGYVSLGNLYFSLDADNCLVMDESMLGWYIMFEGGDYDGEPLISDDNICFMKPNAMQYYYSYNTDSKKFVADSCEIYVDDFSDAVYLYGFCNVGLITVDIDESTMTASVQNVQPLYYEYYQKVDYVFNLSLAVANADGYLNDTIYNDASLTSPVLFAENDMYFGDYVYNEKTQKYQLSPTYFWIGTEYVAGQGAYRYDYIAGVEILLNNGNFKAYDNYIAGIEDLRSEKSAPAALYNLQGLRVKNANGFVAGKNFKAVVR